jgi:hypothetical protein
MYVCMYVCVCVCLCVWAIRRSAGLVTHPDFVDDTRQYQALYGLDKAPGIGLLRYIPRSLSEIV